MHANYTPNSQKTNKTGEIGTGSVEGTAARVVAVVLNYCGVGSPSGEAGHRQEPEGAVTPFSSRRDTRRWPCPLGFRLPAS